jgi:hypothetical protein
MVLLHLLTWRTTEILGVYEMLPNSIIRKAALKEALFQIRCEDENTKFLDLGPVFHTSFEYSLAWF